jgi:hypothetical protein
MDTPSMHDELSVLKRLTSRLEAADMARTLMAADIREPV